VIALFDAGFLHILFDDRARVPLSDGAPIDRAQDRIDYLVQTMSRRKDKIILPTPGLAEFMLLAADRWTDYLTIIRRMAVFEIAGFDDPEAVELVEHWIRKGGKRLKANKPETWAKLKYDRQIVAIAVTRRVERIYSTDKKDMSKFAKRLGKEFFGLADLPLPPPAQTKLFKEEQDLTGPEGKDAESQPSPIPPGVGKSAVQDGIEMAEADEGNQ
jgi:hypothetical protein